MEERDSYSNHMADMDALDGSGPEVESCADCDMEGLVPVTGHDGEPRCVFCACHAGHALHREEFRNTLQEGFYDLVFAGVLR